MLQAVKVPQNVYIEDRIAGPITLRHILICGIGGGITYALWATIKQNYGEPPIVLTILSFVPLILSVGFAFVQLNDLSMFRLLLLLLERQTKPNVRLYAPRQGLTIHIRTFTTAEESAKKKSQPKNTDVPLDHLSKVLDSAIAFEEPEEGESPAHPVRRERIQVDGNADDASVDGITPAKGTVSLFSKNSP